VERYDGSLKRSAYSFERFDVSLERCDACWRYTMAHLKDVMAHY
jgi:hypothetical protein